MRWAAHACRGLLWPAAESLKPGPVCQSLQWTLDDEAAAHSQQRCTQHARAAGGDCWPPHSSLALAALDAQHRQRGQRDEAAVALHDRPGDWLSVARMWGAGSKSACLTKQATSTKETAGTAGRQVTPGPIFAFAPGLPIPSSLNPRLVQRPPSCPRPATRRPLPAPLMLS
jgi:hypothetical protein